MHSIEYVEYRYKLFEEARIGNITFDEVKIQLDEFVTNIILENQRNRMRKYRASIREGVEREEKRHYQRFHIVGNLSF